MLEKKNTESKKQTLLQQWDGGQNWNRLRRTVKSMRDECGLAVILLLFAFLIRLVICYLYQENTESLFYTAVLVLCLAIVVGATRFHYYWCRLEQRESLVKHPESGWKQMPEPDSCEEEDYQEMVENLGHMMEELTIKQETDSREMVDYYTTWVHQVKTPIAVMKLLLDREDTEENRALSAELFRIEQYVEMALNYTRLESESNDLLFQEYDLNDLIRQSLRKYAPQFIYRKIKLVYEPVNCKIVTDQKWFMSIVEQLLSNAIKYTPQGSVNISLNGEGNLEIRDTGIGIDSADLPRIFERGYTGVNGRSEHKSTGLGLYLCKKAADRLEMDITVESEPGKGTCFCLHLPLEAKKGQNSGE